MGDDEKTLPSFNKQSSALVLDDRNVRLSEMDAFNVKIEALLLNFEELSKRQVQNEELTRNAIQELHQSQGSSFKTLVKYSIVANLFCIIWWQYQQKNSKKN